MVEAEMPPRGGRLSAGQQEPPPDGRSRHAAAFRLQSIVTRGRVDLILVAPGPMTRSMHTSASPAKAQFDTSPQEESSPAAPV